MTDFYEPTLLFRQNAVRKGYNPGLSPISSVESLPSTNSTKLSSRSNNSSSWMLNLDNPKDTEVLNQSCALKRLNIKSNYWKIPDSNMNLTAMSVTNTQNDNPVLAISSANNESNLFIYELDVLGNYLTHHNTISLPNVHGIQWVPNSSRFLVTGNNKGYAHLVSVPKINEPRQTFHDDNDEEASAEICKRFNHRKHLKNKKEMNVQSPISKLSFMNNDSHHLLSLYGSNLFYWDVKDCESQVRPSPISISTITGITHFDPLPQYNANMVGICGKFGVSLFDLRQPKFNVPGSVLDYASKKKLGANMMKWNPNDENVFAAAHCDNVIRLWDIRKQDNFCNLNGHANKVTSLEWVNGDLFSGGRDGNVIHWDLTSDMPSKRKHFTNCGLKEGLDSVNFNPKLNCLENTLNQRQCGTVLPASNTNIIGMCSVAGSESNEDLKVLSIDGSSFFGVHSKIYDAVNININSEKLYYTDEDIQLLIQSERSNSTLVNASTDSINEVTEPLSIARKNTIENLFPSHSKSADQPNNFSHETLLDSQEDLSHGIEIIEDHKQDQEEEDDDNEFTFTPPSTFQMKNSNDSVFSIDSEPGSCVLNSTEENLFNGSMDSLSTDPTIGHDDSTPSSLESSPLGRESSFNFQLLDELDFNYDEKNAKRDSSFNSAMFNEIRVNRKASVKTVGSHLYSIYSD
ncbi:WD40-repeat-containing domain protein [Scheffersomyces xylosifermentans]|uniref:WD40-repeat-containing domain protein n=1 Tax=Scheffersomyces xylosifermentans TaxID=1304137 RepID=UPI00315D7374